MSWKINFSVKNEEFMKNLNNHVSLNSIGNSSDSSSPRFPWPPREIKGREEEKELSAQSVHRSPPPLRSYPPRETPSPPRITSKVPTGSDIVRPKERRLDLDEVFRVSMELQGARSQKQNQSYPPRSTPSPTRTGNRAGAGPSLTRPERVETGHQGPPEDPQRFSPIQPFQYPPREGQGPLEARFYEGIDSGRNNRPIHYKGDDYDQQRGTGQSSQRSFGLVAPRHSPRYENSEPRRQDSVSSRREGHFEKLYWEEREARKRLEEKYERRLTETEIIGRTYREMEDVLQKQNLSLFGRYESLIRIIRDPDFKSFVESARFVDHHYGEDKIKKMVEGHPKFEDALVDIIREVRQNFRHLRSPRMFVLRINNIINEAMAERKRRN